MNFLFLTLSVLILGSQLNAQVLPLCKGSTELPLPQHVQGQFYDAEHNSAEFTIGPKGIDAMEIGGSIYRFDGRKQRSDEPTCILRKVTVNENGDYKLKFYLKSKVGSLAGIHFNEHDGFELYLSGKDSNVNFIRSFLTWRGGNERYKEAMANWVGSGTLTRK